MTNEEQDLGGGRGSGFHHRLYPYMDELIQYATEREDGTAWVVRDRSTALRNERRGYGTALVRTWIPTDWYAVSDGEPVTDTQE